MLKKIAKYFLIFCVIYGVASALTVGGNSPANNPAPAKQEPAPAPKPEAPAPVKTETVTKPEPPKVERPEKSFYAESYDALRQVTGLPVTDSWLLEFGEYVDRNGHVNTHGFVEFNDDGVKRQFWLMFDNSTRHCLRVKVDSQLLYTAVGW